MASTTLGFLKRVLVPSRGRHRNGARTTRRTKAFDPACATAAGAAAQLRQGGAVGRALPDHNPKAPSMTGKKYGAADANAATFSQVVQSLLFSAAKTKNYRPGATDILTKRR